jgi:hypothetical protein
MGCLAILYCCAAAACGDNFQGMMVQEYLEYVRYMLDELISLCL